MGKNEKEDEVVDADRYTILHIKIVKTVYMFMYTCVSDILYRIIISFAC